VKLRITGRSKPVNAPQQVRHSERILKMIRGDGLSTTHPNCNILGAKDVVGEINAGITQALNDSADRRKRRP
jgi:hypothetical protein